MNVNVSAPKVDYEKYPSYTVFQRIMTEESRQEIEDSIDIYKTNPEKLFENILCNRSDYAKIIAAGKLSSLGNSISKNQLQDFLGKFLRQDINIWVHSRLYQSLSQMSKSSELKNTIQQFFMDNSIKQPDPYLRLWSLCGLIEMSVIYGSQELVEFIKSRILSDPSNYVRVESVEHIGRCYDGMSDSRHEGSLLEFANQFLSHINLYNSARYIKPIKGYFNNAELLIQEKIPPKPIGQDRESQNIEPEGPDIIKGRSFTERLKEHPVIIWLGIIASIITILMATSSSN